MKWAYDYEKRRPAYIDRDGYNWSENRFMDPGTYDEQEVADDEDGYEHDHNFNQQLLESDEEQARMNGWMPNANYDNTYGVMNADDDYEEHDNYTDDDEDDTYDPYESDVYGNDDSYESSDDYDDYDDYDTD